MPKTIKMTKDYKVADDGVTVQTWLKDSEHENVPDQLADDLINDAKVAKEIKVANTFETKADAKK